MLLSVHCCVLKLHLGRLFAPGVLLNEQLKRVSKSVVVRHLSHPFCYHQHLSCAAWAWRRLKEATSLKAVFLNYDALSSILQLIKRVRFPRF
jgi:hypothetical protein